MNKAKFDSTLLIVLGCAILLIASAGFTSAYASRQASRYIINLVDGTMKIPARKSMWTTLRDGRILGTAVPAKGQAAYVVVARRLGKEYRAIAGVDADGSILKVYPLGNDLDSAYMRRLGVLLGRISKGSAGADVSPLDSAIEPLIIDMMETITGLERARMEVLNGDT
jgi:hypothetical protein